VIRAPFDGQVAYIDANRVILKGRGRGQEETFTINKFKRTSNNDRNKQRRAFYYSALSVRW